MTFDEFYAMYPRKIARHSAVKAWGQVKNDHEAIAEALPRHCQYWLATGMEKEFIPYPASWLRAGRCFDELEAPTQKRTQPEIAWWTTDQGVIEKGKSHGIAPRPGESINEFKSRVISTVRSNEPINRSAQNSR